MSARDKRLLILLGVALVILVVYYVVYRPIVNKRSEIQAEINEYNTELMELRAQYNNIEKYKKAIEEAQLRIADINEIFPSDVEQERVFKLLFDIEEEFPDVQFETLNFSELELLRSNNESNDESTVKAVRRHVITNTTLSYNEFKHFLKFIGAYRDRTVLNNLNLVLDEETGDIGIALTMNMYALSSSQRVSEPIEFDVIDYGNDLLFDSPNINWDLIGREEVSYPSDFQEDLFISLNPIDSDGYTHVMGKVIDSGERSYIQSETNQTLNGVLRIYEEGDSFYASYDIDGIYKERQQFDVQTALELVVYSSSKTEGDNVGLNLSVYNQTDLTLFVDVVSDDVLNPRLNMSVLQGEVTIK